MTQLTLQLRPNLTVLAVLVPEDAKDPWLMETEFPRLGYYDPNRTLDGNTWSESIDLPPGKWEIIGLLREVSEVEAAGLVAFFMRGHFYDYSQPGTYESLTSAIDSLKSAITAEGGDPEKNWLLLKQIQ